jgi:hypothetical protein
LAKAQLMMPSGFLEGIDSFERGFEDAAKQALMDAGAIVLDKMKPRLESVITGDRSTGELVQSLGVSPVKRDYLGNLNIKVGFTEPRSNNGVNAKIANIIEYGSHEMHRQAKPFLKPTRTAARAPALEAMQLRFEQWTQEKNR